MSKAHVDTLTGEKESVCRSTTSKSTKQLRRITVRCAVVHLGQHDIMSIGGVAAHQLLPQSTVPIRHLIPGVSCPEDLHLERCLEGPCSENHFQASACVCKGHMTRHVPSDPADDSQDLSKGFSHGQTGSSSGVKTCESRISTPITAVTPPRGPPQSYDGMTSLYERLGESGIRLLTVSGHDGATCIVGAPYVPADSSRDTKLVDYRDSAISQYHETFLGITKFHTEHDKFLAMRIIEDNLRNVRNPLCHLGVPTGILIGRETLKSKSSSYWAVRTYQAC